jgi:hypothetical protein
MWNSELGSLRLPRGWLFACGGVIVDFAFFLQVALQFWKSVLCRSQKVMAYFVVDDKCRDGFVLMVVFAVPWASLEDYR